MRRVTRNGVIAVAAVSGAMAVTMPVCAAFAADGASADGVSADSSGLVSGNTVQVPVDVPVNVCGNTVSVVGLLNRAVGNVCANTGHADGSGAAGTGAAGAGGTSARGDAQDSGGALAGNEVQIPVHLPVNVSGNSVNGVGVGNSTEGNTSGNDSGDRTPPSSDPTPPTRTAPRHVTPAKADPGAAPRSAAPQTRSSLAHTGAEEIAPAAAASAALLVAGAVLYRRFRTGPQH